MPRSQLALCARNELALLMGAAICLKNNHNDTAMIPDTNFNEPHPSHAAPGRDGKGFTRSLA